MLRYDDGDEESISLHGEKIVWRLPPGVGADIQDDDHDDDDATAGEGGGVAHGKRRRKSARTSASEVGVWGGCMWVSVRACVQCFAVWCVCFCLCVGVFRGIFCIFVLLDSYQHFPFFCV